MNCFSFLKNVVDLLDGEETAFKRRFTTNFSGPLIPFGAEITWKPISSDDEARLHPFGSKRLSGIFVGYEQQAGGGWSGDLLIADWEQIENAEMHSQIHSKKFKAAEVEAVKIGNNFRFPLAEGVLRQPGSDSHKNRSLRLRRAKDDLEHDDGRRTDIEEDETQDDTAEETSDDQAGGDTTQEKSEADFWSFPGDTLIIHHAKARTKLFVPTDDNCPMPVRYLDVMRRTYTDLE